MFFLVSRALYLIDIALTILSTTTSAKSRPRSRTPRVVQGAPGPEPEYWPTRHVR